MRVKALHLQHQWPFSLTASQVQHSTPCLTSVIATDAIPHSPQVAPRRVPWPSLSILSTTSCGTLVSGGFVQWAGGAIARKDTPRPCGGKGREDEGGKGKVSPGSFCAGARQGRRRRLAAAAAAGASCEGDAAGAKTTAEEPQQVATGGAKPGHGRAAADHEAKQWGQ